MSCHVGEVTERLENELCYDYNYELCLFFNLSVTSPTSQFIFQPFHRFTYVTAHSPTIPLLHLRHSSLPNPSFASPKSQPLHLIHLASRPCSERNGFFFISVLLISGVSIQYFVYEFIQTTKYNFNRNAVS